MHRQTQVWVFLHQDAGSTGVIKMDVRHDQARDISKIVSRLLDALHQVLVRRGRAGFNQDQVTVADQQKRTNDSWYALESVINQVGPIGDQFWPPTTRSRFGASWCLSIHNGCSR